MAVYPLASFAATMSISTEERTFFVALGERIAALRRAHDVTQMQLAQALVLAAVRKRANMAFRPRFWGTRVLSSGNMALAA